MDEAFARKTRWAYYGQFFALVFGLCLLSYFRVLDNGFLGDDVRRIQHSPDLDSLFLALTGGLADRPLLMLTLWVDKGLFHFSPFWMRVEGLVLHALVCLQLFLLLKEINVSFQRPQKTSFLVLLTLMFALHPLHGQTLNIIIQRGVILSSLFSLLAVRFLLKDLVQKSTLSFLPLLFFLLSLLCKGISVFLPFFFLYLARFVFQRKGKDLRFLIPYFLFLLIPCFFYFFAKINPQDSAVTPSWIKYFFVQTQIIFHYFGLMLVPYGLKYLYDFYPPENWFLHFYWIFLALHGGLLATVSLVREKIVFAFFVGMYLAFLPESGFFPIVHLAFEHRTYLPMIFLFVFLGLTLEKVFSLREKLAQGVMVTFLLAYLLLNQVRNSQIRPPSRWKLHTLQNSDSRHMYNFMFTFDLIEEGLEEETRELIRHYREKYPTAEFYRILADIHTYTFRPVHGGVTLESLSQNLWGGGEMIADVRVSLNQFILKKKLGPTLSETKMENLVWVGHLLSRQAEVFSADPGKFARLMKMHQVVALALGKNRKTD